MVPTIQNVRDYWNEFSNDIEVCENAVGTREFFDELENYRYTKLSYIPDYVKFENYKDKKVLEIGCGPGVDLLQFARGGADIHAIDLAPRSIELSRRNLEVHGFGHLANRVNVGNAEQTDFVDNTFDVVFSNGVLHHTVDTEGAIEEVRRILKPGGEAIVMLYNRRSWFTFLAAVSGTKIEHAEVDAPIIRSYTVAEIRKIFSSFGGPIDVEVHRPPVRTLKFKGMKGWLYNNVFVPGFNLLPEAVSKPLGFHIFVRAIKAG